MESLLNIFDVSEITKIKVATLRKYVLRGTIPFRKLGAAVRFKPSEIEAWINGEYQAKREDDRCH
jgi:excisionase family DNA binding protein